MNKTEQNTNIRDNREELRNELEEYLNGLRICDDISRNEQYSILDDFDQWCKTATIGDTYYYDDNEYTLGPEDEEDDE